MHARYSILIKTTQLLVVAVIFAAGVFVIQPDEASAATFQARPDGDVTTNWAVTGSSCSGGHWCAIDDNVTTSGTGDFTDNVNTGGNNDLDRWTMTSPTKVDTATDLTAHVYYDATSNRNLSNNMQPQINLYINGSQVGSTYSCANATGSGSWCTATTISGTWSQADIDTLEMEMNSNKNGGGPADTLRVAASYVKIGFTKSQSFEQSSYRLFENTDSTDVGSALAAENTSATLSNTGVNFRLRQLIHVSGSNLSTSGQNFKLQFAKKGGGTCSSPDGSYTDVTSSTNIAYLDNPTPADGDALTATSADPTHGGDTVNDQTYEESNNFTNSQSSISAGSDGLWDFALTDNGAAAGNTYCIRTVLSDGTALSTYTNYPQVTIPSVSFNHSAFRFFSNNDSTDVGSALASQDTDITLSSSGQDFRLRSLFHVSGADLTQSGQDFQLEFADKSGYNSCADINSSDWSEVKTSTSSVGTLGSDWTEATSSADWTARALHEAVTFDGKMWVIGGNDGNLTSEVWSSTDGKNWTLETSSPGWAARASHEVVVYDGRIWVLGGKDSNGTFLNDVWYSSDGVNWTEQTASAPWSSRWRMGTASYDNKLWMTGGYDGSTTQDDVWYYASSSSSWTQASSTNAWNGRALHETLVYDNKIWVIGGKVGAGTIQDSVWYSTDGANWTEATSAASWPERFTFASYVIDGKLWVAGGEDNNSNRLNDVWYTTDGTNWTEATSSAGWSLRKHMAATVYDGKMWVFGGNNDSLVKQNDVWYSGLSNVAITYNDNPTPADGAALTDNSNDPTHGGDAVNNQTYEEQNTFTNSQSAIAAGEDGLWDFSLTASSEAPTSTPYCLRPTKSDGTTFSTYDQYPQVTTASGSVISVTVSDGDVSYGILTASTSEDTINLSDTQTATNDGDVTADFNIKGQDATSGSGTDWTLATSPGVDQYTHRFSTDSGSSWVYLSTNYKTLATGVSTSGTQDFDLEITTPQDSTDSDTKNADVTVQAVQN